MSVTQATVRIAAGEVAGTGTDVRAYLGIPYAAPPVGPLRWRPPQPVKPWSGVHDGSHVGPDAMQIPEPVPIRRSLATTYSEDCLNLNVWAPANPPAGGAPVIVYFDFGGYIAGSASRERINGEAYARRGVILVTVNHRVGVFGFLAHPKLSAESPHHVSGNYGFLDAIASLQWVHDNIAAFGGDPSRVTITGASAGAATSYLMLISPLAKGLVHRMIYRSGSAFRGIRTLAEAETAGLAVGNDLEALRALPAADVLKLNGVVDPANHPDVPGVRPLLNVPFLRPIVDGYVFDRTDVEAYFSGAFAAVPSIVGNVTSESGGAITANIPIDTAAALRLHLQESFGDEFEEAWRLFGTENDAEARQKLVEVWMDNRYSFAVRALGREIAKRQPKTFRYLFSHAGTHTANPPVHGNDMTYVFGTGDFDARDRVISDAILAAFSNFAATGDPNGPGAPHWSPYDPAQENYLTLGGNLEEGSHWRTEQAAFFENYFLR